MVFLYCLLFYDRIYVSKGLIFFQFLFFGAFKFSVNILVFESGCYDVMKSKQTENKIKIKKSCVKNRAFSVVVLFAFFAVAVQLFIPAFVVHADVNDWEQTDWSGGVSVSVPDHQNNRTGWTNYSAIDSYIDTSTSNEFDLSTDTVSWDQDSEAEFNQGTFTSNTENSSGSVILTSSGGAVSTAQVTAGRYHTCALSEEGEIYCWGRNNYNQLGDNTTTQRETPVQVLRGDALTGDHDGTYLTNIKNLSAGENHTCAVSNNDNIYCWGRNNINMLGDGTTTQRTTPIRPLAGASVAGDNNGTYLDNIKSVSAGQYHTCAVSESDNIYCWGRNTTGQLGDNSTTQRSTAIRIDTGASVAGDNDGTYLDNISNVETGVNHTCAVSNNDNIYCWGYNLYGQLGDGTTTQRTTPIRPLAGASVAGDNDGTYLDNIKSVSPGSEHTCAVSMSDNIYCWGLNNSNQLGDGTNTARTTPIRPLAGASVAGDNDGTYLDNINNMEAGVNHTCAISNNNNPYCWGYNLQGQLGDSTTTQRNSAIRVHGVNDVGYLDLSTTIVYDTPGTYTSVIYDTSSNQEFSTVSWVETLPASTSLSVKIRTSDDSGMSGASAWGSCSAVTSGSDISSNSCVTDGERYIQYQIELSTADTSVTPSLDSLTLNYLQYHSSTVQILTSSVYDSTFDTNIINSVQLDTVGGTIPSGTTLRMQIRSGANDDPTSGWTSWCGAVSCDIDGIYDYDSDYVFDFNNSNIGTFEEFTTNTIFSIGDDDRYFQYRVILGSDGSATPTVTSVITKLDDTSPTNVGVFSVIADSTDQLTVTAQTAVDSGVGLSSSPYWFNETSGNTGASSSVDWQTPTFFVDNSLFSNTEYSYQVKAIDALDNESSYSSVVSAYTLASIPGIPTVEDPTISTLDVSIDVNSNPTVTEFAVYKEEGSSCDGLGGSYIASDGSDNGGVVVWQTNGSWGTITATGLSASTIYSFCVKARNGENVETSFGSVGSETTSTLNTAPNIPVLVSPIDGVSVSDSTPTVSVSYSDSDNDDTGTTNYRVSSSSLADCTSNVGIVSSGLSAETSTNNENTSWTSSSLNEGTYYWCAQNDDGLLTSLWTEIGNFSVVANEDEEEDEDDEDDDEDDEDDDEDEDSTIKNITRIFSPFIPEFLQEKEEEIVPQKTPLALSGTWELLPSLKIYKFTTLVLPKEFDILIEKFPQFEKSFQKFGSKILAGLDNTFIESIALPRFNKISKEKIPEEVMFVRAGAKNIDIGIDLSIDKKGDLQQKMTAITGANLNFIIKPIGKAKKVAGQLIIKDSQRKVSSHRFSTQNIFSSLALAQPVLASAYSGNQSDGAEDRFVLLEFEYLDHDQDGFYEADILVPSVRSEMEIVTLIDYENAEKGQKEIKITAVVDPDGYVYEKIENKEARVSEVKVSLYQLNFESGQYELWQAEDYAQKNPQITDKTGQYSFLVPEGTYRITAENFEYNSFSGKSFSVKEGEGIHQNIKLQPKQNWLQIIDWKIATLCLLVIGLLAYGLYRYSNVKNKTI